jgi:hypothetical protein
VIFRRSFIGSSSEPATISTAYPGVIPASLMGHCAAGRAAGTGGGAAGRRASTTPARGAG